MRTILLALALCSAAVPALAQSHPCAAEAAKKGLALLKLHTEADDRAAVDGSAKKIGTVKALKGKGAFDVLEVEGSVYKANYRMRLIFAQIPGSCVLMGQEILERSDPY